MKSTREVILKNMLDKGKSTIGELAEIVGINPISVRHHISKLEAEGLVFSEEERHGVGRPRRIYFLTERGTEIFPSRYVQLTNRLLDQLNRSDSENKLKDYFFDMGSNIAKNYISRHHLEDLHNLNLEERLAVLKDLFFQEGISIYWEKNGEGYLVHNPSCPYLQVEQEHPEICTLDRAIISKMTLIPLENIKFTHHNNEHCIFNLPLSMGVRNEQGK